MIIIEDYSTLKRYKETIVNLYNKYGVMFHQSYESLKSEMLSRKEEQIVIFLDASMSYLLAFERHNKYIWKSIIYSFPILNNGKLDSKMLVNILNEIKEYLKAESLYFPQVYETDSIYRLMCEIDNIVFWNRLPTSIIDCDFSSEEIIDKSIKRDGSIFKRQQKAFEKTLNVNRLYKEEAINALRTIELNSWKRKCKQDMLSRGNQYDYYSNLLNLGVADLIVACDSEGIPVAYRLDAIVKDIVYIIKSSYDEKYKKYSPGSYLLSFDVTKRYCKSKYKYIDLYGSPSLIKDMVETGKINRIDVCYPNSYVIDELKSERLEFDQKFLENYMAAKPIKNLYINKCN